MVVYNATKNSNNFSVPIGNLKNGNYILLVTDGINKNDSHFIVNHK